MVPDVEIGRVGPHGVQTGQEVTRFCSQAGEETPGCFSGNGTTTSLHPLGPSPPRTGSHCSRLTSLPDGTPVWTEVVWTPSVPRAVSHDGSDGLRVVA